ncbi:hypothetical protein [Alsobacter sp. R-9]
MRASSGVSSLSQDFRTRRAGAGGVESVTVQRPGRRIGFVSSAVIVVAAVGFGWLVGSGRLVHVVAMAQDLLHRLH